MHQKSAKYIPLEPLDESPDSSWGEAAQARLLELELEGKGYKKLPKEVNEEVKPANNDKPADIIEHATLEDNPSNVDSQEWEKK